MPFNFTGLAGVYREAYLRNDPTVAFELRNGRGRFVFLVFFSEEDETAKDYLYLFLMNTRQFLKLKMYGSHKDGDFNVYVDGWRAEAVVRELQLEGGRGREPLDLDRLLGELNAAIPATLPLRRRIETLRAVWPHVGDKLSHVVEWSEKTELIGWKNLPEGQQPKDRTLRKLYLFRTESAEVVEDLIKQLRAKRRTLAWTKPDPSRKRESWAVMFRDF